MKLTDDDRRAFDFWWDAADKADPDEVDRRVRAQCDELERQFVYDQEGEDAGV